MTIDSSGDLASTGGLTVDKTLHTTKTGSATDPALLIGVSSGWLSGNNTGIMLEELAPNSTLYVPYFVSNGSKIFGFGSVMSMEKNLDMKSNKIYFDSDSTNTYIAANTDNPEDLEVHSDQDILLMADATVAVKTTTPNSAADFHVKGDSYFDGHQILRIPDSNDTYFGQIVTFGSGPSGSNLSIEQGKIYYYASTGYWEEADASSSATSKNLLAVATESGSVRMMVGGTARHGSWAGLGNGSPLYLSETSGELTNTPPTTTGAIVRFIGYCTNTSTRDIYFCPSPDYIEN